MNWPIASITASPAPCAVLQGDASCSISRGKPNHSLWTFIAFVDPISVQHQHIARLQPSLHDRVFRREANPQQHARLMVADDLDPAISPPHHRSRMPGVHDQQAMIVHIHLNEQQTDETPIQSDPQNS